jgi:hypothetical protein
VILVILMVILLIPKTNQARSVNEVMKAAPAKVIFIILYDSYLILFKSTKCLHGFFNSQEAEERISVVIVCN